MEQPLHDYYRLAINSNVSSCFLEEPDGDAGFFRFGANAVCFGSCKSSVSSDLQNLGDASKDVRLDGSTVHLPFSMSEVIDNLRLERYVNGSSSYRTKVFNHPIIRNAYYWIRPLLPGRARRALQRAYLKDWQDSPFPHWPVDFSVETLHEKILMLAMQAHGVRKIPFIWFWPDSAPSCLIMTHDVETTVGRDFTSTLMNMDASYGMRASFQAVPEGRYALSRDYVREIRDRGFEFNIHDLNHDGHLYRDRAEFLSRARKINEYIRVYAARGFRSGSMYRNPAWYDVFEFSYDMSIPNNGHLEPQRGGCCTVMPYFIGKVVELPLTAAEDYSLFHILDDYSTTLWKNQLALIRQKNGLMSFIVHPDYVIEHRARKVFEMLLDYLQQMVEREKIWMALPGDVDRWWRARNQMKLMPRGNGWEIEGPESARARLAYAVLDGNTVTYELAGPSTAPNDK